MSINKNKIKYLSMHDSYTCVRNRYKFIIYLKKNLRNISKTNIYTSFNENENSYL